jgi:hypothetical protein
MEPAMKLEVRAEEGGTLMLQQPAATQHVLR